VLVLPARVLCVMSAHVGAPLKVGVQQYSIVLIFFRLVRVSRWSDEAPLFGVCSPALVFCGVVQQNEKRERWHVSSGVSVVASLALMRKLCQLLYLGTTSYLTVLPCCVG